MRKASTAAYKHYRRLPDGAYGCYTSDCPAPATWWADHYRADSPSVLRGSTAYCDEHGEYEVQDGLGNPVANSKRRPVRNR